MRPQDTVSVAEAAQRFEDDARERRERRDMFAAMAITSVTAELNAGNDTVAGISAALGIEPSSYRHEIHWDQWVAMHIALRADAILAVLTKPVTP